MRRSESLYAVAVVVLAGLVGFALSRAFLRLESRAASGNFGYTPNPAATAEFLRQLDEPRFSQAGRDCMANVQKVDTLLYRYADEAHREVYGKPFTAWNQGNHGSCVSFGYAVASYIGQSVDWKQGELAAPPKLVATEPIYAGSRTYGRMPPVSFAGFMEGSYGAAAARWVAGKCKDDDVGGIVFREVVGKYDLSRYSIEVSREWGAYGPPREIALAAAKHRAMAVAQVSTWGELAAALTSGYCVPICSNVGFAATNVRDRDGFLPRGGQWNHCMCIIGIRFADGPGKRDGALVLNSWGTTWVTGGRWPDDQPDGSFWITREDAEAILRQSDSFAVGGVSGFPWRKLEHREWLEPAPQASAAPTKIVHALSL